MRFEFSPQYNRACAVIEEGDSYGTVVQHPDISNCFYNDGLERLVCVRFPGFQQGLYTREALRGLMGGQASMAEKVISGLEDFAERGGDGLRQTTLIRCPHCKEIVRIVDGEIR